MPSDSIKKGFALIEALVAIIILSIVITAGFTAISSSISSTSGIKDEMIAYQLANEAIEMVRNIQSTSYDGWLANPITTTSDWVPGNNEFHNCRTPTEESIQHPEWDNYNQCAIRYNPGISLSFVAEEKDKNICVSNSGIQEISTVCPVGFKTFTRQVQIDKAVEINPMPEESGDSVLSKDITVTVSWFHKAIRKSVTVKSVIFR